ncbi:hypothetical protein, partial [Xanthomonas citri]|uniref:hypothetical protein n=1 Tax=Xanthomonas citri TaxID=346 RepID=UPI00058B48DE
MSLHRTRLFACFLYALGVPAFAYGLNTWTQAHVQHKTIEGRDTALRTAQTRFWGSGSNGTGKSVKPVSM